MPDSGTTSESPATNQTTLPGDATTGAPATEDLVDMGDIIGFDVIDVTLGGEAITVALADEPALRSRGLMGVADLGDLDGMLFSWGGDTVSSRFTMRNTLIPLRIVFFDVDGAFVSRADMVPCETDDCPTYGAAGPYAFAIEFPAGRVVSTDDRLEVDQPG